MIINCVECGKNFQCRRNTRKYCSDCARKIKNQKTRLLVKKIRENNAIYLKKTCPICGKSFSTVKTNQKFCSNSCYMENRRLLSALRYHTKGKYIKEVYNKRCSICGNDFVTTNNRRKYCCLNCQKIARIAKVKERQERIKNIYESKKLKQQNK